MSYHKTQDILAILLTQFASNKQFARKYSPPVYQRRRIYLKKLLCMYIIVKCQVSNLNQGKLPY